MAGDPYWLTNAFVLNFDGANGSTAMVDSSVSPRVLTVDGAAVISTAQSKFGGSSLYLPGSGSGVYVPSTGGIATLTADFSFEAFVRPTSSSQSQHQIIDARNGAGQAMPWVFVLEAGGGSFHLMFYDGAAHTGTLDVPVDTWSFVELSRIDGVIYAFVEGVPDFNYASTAVLAGATSGAAIRIGGKDQGSFNFTGYLDSIRFNPHRGRHSEAYDPPTSPFPLAGCVISGVITDEEGAYASRIVRAYSRESGALVGATVSDAGTGTYEMIVETEKECTVIALDDATAPPLKNDLVARVVPA